MRTGLSLTELAQKIEDQRGAKKDMIADTRKMAIDVDFEEVPNTDTKAPVVKLNVEGQGSYPIRPIAHGQIGERVGIPAKYYDRMLAKAPRLLAQNVNHWFHENPEKRMVRTLGGNARAFMSNRYQRIDNEHIAEVTLPVLAQYHGITIPSAEITERRLYIQAVYPSLQAEVKGSRRVGDIVQAGLVITNSEVGFGAVSISDLDYFLACLNGMVSTKLLRSYHVGRQLEDNADLWSDDTKKADDRAVLLKVRDMVTAALDKARFEARVERMSALTQIEVKKDPAKSVEVLADKLNVTEGEKGSILTALIKGGDLSAWGFLNAVTAQAHDSKDYDRSVEFEAMGGQLLQLPKKDWEDILEAA